MSVRVGKLVRHEDVHGVSGTGDHKADVFEASDGTIVLVWLGPDSSVQSYRNIKNAQNVHGHGGKTDIDWIWEQERDPDPMEKVFEKKIIEAGGSVPEGDTDAPKSEDDASQVEGIVDEIAEKVVEKLREDAPE